MLKCEPPPSVLLPQGPLGISAQRVGLGLWRVEAGPLVREVMPHIRGSHTFQLLKMVLLTVGDHYITLGNRIGIQNKRCTGVIPNDIWQYNLRLLT